MKLFGEKCNRCGVRTRNKADDVPVCERCATEMELAVAAGSEDVRSCPVDGADMKKEIAHIVVIDRCSECGGVWLDAGELRLIREDVEDMALRSLTSSFTLPPV
jgi:hypothetical protein